MPGQEEIDDQLELLTVYRRILARYLRHQDQLGEAYAPPPAFEGAYEARENIRCIKRILHSWGIPIENRPNDEDLGEILQLELKTENKTNISNPSQADIMNIINSLSENGNSFAILERRTNRGDGFIQIAISDQITGFYLEYEEGSIERHYEVIHNPNGYAITANDVTFVFQSYANGDDSWKGKYEWRKVNF